MYCVILAGKPELPHYFKSIWFDALGFLYSVVLLRNCLLDWHAEVLEFNSLFEYSLLKCFSSRRINCTHFCFDLVSRFEVRHKSLLWSLGCVVLVTRSFLKPCCIFWNPSGLDVNSQGFTGRFILVDALVQIIVQEAADARDSSSSTNCKESPGDVSRSVVEQHKKLQPWRRSLWLGLCWWERLRSSWARIRWRCPWDQGRRNSSRGTWRRPPWIHTRASPATTPTSSRTRRSSGGGSSSAPRAWRSTRKGGGLTRVSPTAGCCVTTDPSSGGPLSPTLPPTGGLTFLALLSFLFFPCDHECKVETADQIAKGRKKIHTNIFKFVRGRSVHNGKVFANIMYK